MADVYTRAGMFVDTFCEFFVEDVSPQLLFSKGFDYDLKVTVKHTGKHITSTLIKRYQRADEIEWEIDSRMDDQYITVKATKTFNHSDL